MNPLTEPAPVTGYIDCGSGHHYGICPKCRRGHGHIIALTPDNDLHRSQLQAAHAAAIARARKVAMREHNLITTFALSDEIEQIETQASESFGKGEIEAYTVLCIVARRLRALIPV